MEEEVGFDTTARKRASVYPEFIPTTGGAGWWWSPLKREAAGGARRPTLSAPLPTPKLGAPPLAAEHHRRGVCPPLVLFIERRRPMRLCSFLP